ncbi:Acg family FMN-binding oxidoreductase [Amycolatopsis thermoflava]|uniref:Acg family FMN-binding oxidoreductase n=1 Tax=Amycolatopsis thermoflava TaxID=84480 RepID=UPI003D7305C4
MTWTATELGVLARAVARAPSVHNSQPWVLVPGDGVIELCERTEVELPRHDPEGRDRLMSCGAALVNLRLALSALGRRPQVTLLPRPDVVAEVRAPARAEPSPAELGRYSAIYRRHSHRAPFALHRVPAPVLRELADAALAPGAQARLVEPRTESGALAELLGHAGLALRDDPACQRELTAWTAQFRQAPAAVTTLPWSGLVRADTRLPDPVTLAARIAAESMLVVVTAGDGRRDHVLAGAALQETWLTAITRGLAGSVVTQPLHLPEVRAGLIERLALPGWPQALLRFGYPVTAAPP